MSNLLKSLAVKFLVLLMLFIAIAALSLPATNAQDFCNDQCVTLDDGTRGCLVNGGGQGLGCRLTSSGCVNLRCKSGGEGPGPILD